MARRTFVRVLRHLVRDERGAGAVELALVAGTLSTLMLSGVEISRYYYAQMELENAVQMAGQSIWKLCDTNQKVPVTTKCAGYATTLSTALTSSRLGNQVSLSTGFPTEAYYCIATSSGALTKVGEVTAARPANCSPTGSSTDIPATYMIIQAQYTYRPIFRGVTIGSLLPTTVRAATTMRVQ